MRYIYSGENPGRLVDIKDVPVMIVEISLKNLEHGLNLEIRTSSMAKKSSR